MLFSEYFSVRSGDWFDPILVQDTALFIDPLLLCAQPGFDGAREELIRFFDISFREAARIADVDSAVFRRLLRNLAAPEARELCLGYTKIGTRGAGSGPGRAAVLADGLLKSLAAGIEHLDHFETIGLLQPGIGPDLISDMTVTILRERIGTYTTDVCRDLGIDLNRVHHPRLRFDERDVRWVPGELSLPVVDLGSGARPIMLVPKACLRPLPSFSWQDFRDFLFDENNQGVRDEIGLAITAELDRADIVGIASRSWTSVVPQYIAWRQARRAPAYPLRRDPSRRYELWVRSRLAGQAAAPDHVVPDRSAAVVSFVDHVIAAFKHFIEESDGWTLVWNENGSAKNETSAQVAFHAFASAMSEAVDVDVTREAGTGRGPVDFKFAFGRTARVVVEIKLASNSRLAHGVRTQLPTYAIAQETRHARVVIVAHKEAEHELVTNKLPDWLNAVRRRNIEIEGTLVSALKPLSASRTGRGKGKRTGRVPLPARPRPRR